MISDLLDAQDSAKPGVRGAKLHPTLKMVQKQLKGFDDALVMYVYHTMNGREDEAQSYLQEWKEEQEEIQNSFSKLNVNERIAEHDSSVTDGDAKE